MKKICSIILTILMLSLFALMALGSSEAEPDVTPADSAQTTDSGKENKEENAQTTVHVGEVLTANKLKITYVSCDDYTDYNEYFGPKDGYKFIKLTLEAENIGDSDAYISSFEFKCYADGLAMDSEYESDSLSATLSAGRKAVGGVYFEVPTDAKNIEVEYETNFWTNKKAIFVVK